MNSEEYIKKYNLNNTFNFDRTAFIQDMMHDFDESIVNASPVDRIRFIGLVDDLRIVWDNIFEGSKVSKEYTDKFWSFVYATEVVPRRYQLGLGKRPSKK
jgi:hypothetical protein